MNTSHSRAIFPLTYVRLHGKMDGGSEVDRAADAISRIVQSPARRPRISPSSPAERGHAAAAAHSSSQYARTTHSRSSSASLTVRVGRAPRETDEWDLGDGQHVVGAEWEYYGEHARDDDDGGERLGGGGGPAVGDEEGRHATSNVDNDNDIDSDIVDDARNGGWWRSRRAGDDGSGSDDDGSEDEDDDSDDAPDYIDDDDDDEWDDGPKQTISQRARVALFVSADC
jgi:hypothetical protein